MGMDPRQLAALAHDEEDDARLARMTPAERLETFLELCELTDSIVRHRPDAERLRAPTPRSPASEALWMSLIERAHGERA